MSDPRAMVRVLDELLWTLRRGGFRVATSQAIDVVRAVEATGLGDPGAVREAVACIVVQRARDRARFDALFSQFFDPTIARGTLWERLAAQGFAEAELAELRDLLARVATSGADGAQHLGTLLEGSTGATRSKARP